jgi:glycosyltransferase involved in cell wall biosynthesis
MNSNFGKIGVLEIHGTATKFGGASNGTKILMEELTRAGLNMVICYNRGNEVLDAIKTDFQSYPMDLSSKNPFTVLLNIISLRRILKRNDINIIHSHHRNDNIYACILKLLYPHLKVFYTAHGISIVNSEDNLIYKLLRRINLLLINRCIDTVIYISEYTKEKVYPYFSKVRHHVTIHNGTPKPEAKYTRKEIRSEIGLAEEDFMVSIIGDIGGVKRPEIVLDIAKTTKEIKRICFVFIGDGEKKQQIKELALLSDLNIIFIGSKTDIGSYIQASDIIISTAVEEGFGRTLIEAMAWKKPIIAFNSGGPREIVDHGENGFLIENGNIDDYVDKIIFFAFDQQKYMDFGNAGFNKYTCEFTQETYANNYLRLFKNSELERKSDGSR